MIECLIDTDILFFYLKGDKSVVAKADNYLSAAEFSYLTISEITYYEIRAGLEYRQAKKQIQQFEDFILTCRLIKITKSSLVLSAKEYARLRRKGIIIGTPDLLIAGIALEHGLTLVSNNIKHYRPIKHLKLANWKN